MLITREEFKEAFREAMAQDYADVPSPEKINHKFSPEFYEKMEELIAGRKKGADEE